MDEKGNSVTGSILNQGAKKGTAKIAMALITNPLFWAIAGGVVLIFIIIIIVAAVAGSEGANKGSIGYGGLAGSSCQYEEFGNVENLEVELINCDATSSNHFSLETVPFEKYVLGVALAEIGPGSPEEAIKAQIIMARNFALTRGLFGSDASSGKIKLRACEYDQVYWDYTKDIYRVGGSNGRYTPEIDAQTTGAAIWKSALSEEDQKKYESLANEVLGMLILDKSGVVLKTGYKSAELGTDLGENVANSNEVLQLANQGLDYNQILLKVYKNADAISKSTCSHGSSELADVSGDYQTWKQWDSRWANQPLGSSTLGKYGCAITSLAMVLARSGVEHTVQNLNPGTFLTAFKSVGGMDDDSIRDWARVSKLTVNNNLYLDRQIGGPKYSYTNDQKKELIKGLIEENCITVMQVKSGVKYDTHFVVIDDINTKKSNYEKYYMWDPGYSATDLFAKHNRAKNWGNRYLCFKVR